MWSLFANPVTFITDIRQIKGADNAVADALSRMRVDALQEERSPVVNFKAMAVAQQEDPELLQLQCSSSSLSTGVPRPFVPARFRRMVFNSLHSLSHPGIRSTQRLLTARYVWPSINADVRKWARSCLQCQRSKVQ